MEFLQVPSWHWDSRQLHFYPVLHKIGVAANRLRHVSHRLTLPGALNQESGAAMRIYV